MKWDIGTRKLEKGVQRSGLRGVGRTHESKCIHTIIPVMNGERIEGELRSCRRYIVTKMMGFLKAKLRVTIPEWHLQIAIIRRLMSFNVRVPSNAGSDADLSLIFSTGPCK